MTLKEIVAVLLVDGGVWFAEVPPPPPPQAVRLSNSAEGIIAFKIWFIWNISYSTQ
jgi:hypothetical protein